MSLRRKILLLTSLSLFFLVALIYLVVVAVLLDGFAGAERQQTEKRVGQVQELLRQRLQALDGTCHDWSSWDDTYAFVENRNAEYRTDNLSYISLRNIDLDLMAIVDARSRVVWAGWLDADGKRLAPPPAPLAAALQRDGTLLRQLRARRGSSGFLSFADSPGGWPAPMLMVAARPVLHSDERGPNRGYLVMGRLLAGEELASLEAATGLRIEAGAASAPLPAAQQALLARLPEAGGILVQPEQDNSVAGYSTLPGLSGQREGLLRVSERRDIFEHGWNTVHFMVLPVIVCGVLLGLLLLLLLERLVLSRVARLSSAVTAAADAEAPSEPIALKGNDELAALASAINSTLAALARSHERVREQQQMDRAITESVPLGLLVIDSRGLVLAANRQVRVWFPGLESGEGRACSEVFGGASGCGPCSPCSGLQSLTDGQVRELNWTTRGPDGGIRSYRSLFSPVQDAAGRPDRVLVVVNDETHHLQLEEQLRQRAKEEAIGRLAGGIARDFSNLLSVIISSLSAPLIAPPRAADIERAREASRQAADLAGQLLAFSRHQTPQIDPVQLNDIVTGAIALLRRAIPESIHVHTRLATGLWETVLDPSQAQQLVVNLITNARDAMPTGGLLTITTENTTLARPLTTGHQTVGAGEYVVLTVADSGEGISEKVLDHIFEPYFTTKERSSGTGLGLPLVAAVVGRAGGYVTVQSTVGGGSEFRLYLLRDVAPAVQAPAPEPRPSRLASLQGTVLMAEDNAMVREVGREVLEAAGLRVLSAACGAEALQLLDSENDLDLLFADVVMPGMSGPALAAEARRRLPELKILFASGHTDRRIAEDELPGGDYTFIAKPYDPTTLLGVIGDILGQ